MNKNILKFLTFIAIIFALKINFKVSAHTQIEENEDEILSIENNIVLIEEELLNNSSDVISELNKLIKNYEDLLPVSSQEDIESILNLIDATQKMIQEYQIYKDNISLYGVYDPIYSPAVSSVIAYFSLMNYDLAAELLTHARSNNSLDSYYSPVYGSIVKESMVYIDIVYGSSNSGTATFPKSGGYKEIDLYYAIKKFSYTKSYSGSVVVISDRYDFSPGDYYGIVELAVDTMYKAQLAGVIVPYYVDISQKTTFPSGIPPIETINVTSRDRLIERRVTLGTNEYKEFLISFVTGGTKVIQTFGYKDAVLELYNSEGIFITDTDDEGFGNNALLSYDFITNIQYIIRVKFWSSTRAGEIKLAILPSDSYSQYEDITRFEYGSIYTNITLPLNKVELFTYVPFYTQQYKITTDLGTLVNDYYDTYLYVIDPRSTMPVSNNFEKPSAYDDDSGGNLQAEIVKSLTAGVPYLIVVSTYNITTPSGRFLFIISNQID